MKVFIIAMLFTTTLKGQTYYEASFVNTKNDGSIIVTLDNKDKEYELDLSRSELYIRTILSSRAYRREQARYERELEKSQKKLSEKMAQQKDGGAALPMTPLQDSTRPVDQEEFKREITIGGTQKIEIYGRKVNDKKLESSSSTIIQRRN